MSKTIVLATDHAGFELKEHVKKFLLEKGFEIKDFGALEYDALDDYPDFIIPASKFVSKNKLIGIIFGVIFGKVLFPWRSLRSQHA